MGLVSTRDIKATRKPHTCDWCGEPIAMGAPAHYWAGMDDEAGEFCYGYMHRECREAEKAWFANDDLEDDYWEPGSMVRGEPQRKQEQADA